MNHFAKLYLDEDVSVILAKVLSGRGFDVLTAKDADMLRKSDEEQLLFGTKHSRAILTTVAISRSYTQAPVCRTSTSRVAVPGRSGLVHDAGDLGSGWRPQTGQ